MWGQGKEAGDHLGERTLGGDRAGPQLGREQQLVLGARRQRVEQVRGGRQSRGIRHGGPGGDVSAWL